MGAPDARPMPGWRYPSGRARGADHRRPGLVANIVAPSDHGLETAGGTMKGLGLGLLILGGVAGGSWLVFHFWTWPPIEAAVNLVQEIPERLELSSDDERTEWNRARMDLRHAPRREGWNDEEAFRYKRSVVARVRLCRGGDTDLVVRDADLSSDMSRHFERYCRDVAKFGWTDYLGMYSEYAILERDVRKQLAPSPRSLLRSLAEGFASRVVGVLALLASVLGLLLTFLAITEKLRAPDRNKK